MDFVQLGMYKNKNGQVDTQRVMQMVRLAHPDALYEDEDIHSDLQRDENDILWQDAGPIPVPQEWEMHDIHLGVMEKEMNSMKWKQKAQADPAWAQRWLQHRMGHVSLRFGSMPQQTPMVQSETAPA